MAGFAVKNPAGQIVHPYQWQAQSDYSDSSSMGKFSWSSLKFLSPTNPLGFRWLLCDLH